MKYVIVCEDDEISRKIIETHINEYFNSNSMGEIILSTEKPQEVLDYIRSNKNMEFVYFFDIALNDNLNGLTLAKEIRKYDIYGDLIFITSHAELTLKTFQYKLKALDYILKGPDVKKNIWECLDQIHENSKMNKVDEKDNHYFIAKLGSYIYKIPYNEIVCFETESNNHKIVLTTIYKKIEIRSSLKKIEEELNEKFYRSHRTTIINLEHIESIYMDNFDNHVKMKTGKKCSLSKKYAKGVLKYVESIR